MRASPNVIHPRSSGGSADSERASTASVVPSSYVAAGGADVQAQPHAIPSPVVGTALRHF
jgi:hypothetical protein